MGEIMDSALFRVLPSDQIQRLFGALETLDRHAGECIFRQGDAGDYVYIVERGYCEVVRCAGGGRQEIHVVDLRPGDTFGEAAVISGHPRDASVIALTEARLHRLAKADFDTLVRAPLVHPLSAAAALDAVAAGARWLDIGDPEIYAKAPLRNSRNVPLSALRVQSARLAREDTYLVCCDDPALSAVGAYVLAERGFRVFYLDAPIVMVLGSAVAPAPRDDRISDNVVAFPGPAAPPAIDTRNSAPGATMETQFPPVGPAPADANTLERADRRVTQQEFEAAARALNPLPQESFADTHTGATLASLMADIDARTQNLGAVEADADPMGLDESGTEYIDFDELEATTLGGHAVAAPLPLPVAPPIGDPVAEMVHDLEARLRAYVETNLLERTLHAERRYREKVARLQERAEAKLRQRDAELKARYAAQLRRKDQALREHYQKLMTLATRISQQKAQLQAARRQFEEKLKKANAVYKQVEDMRRLLGEQVGRPAEPLDSGQRQSAL
jgi:rhodanese-related sulfurtransferase